MKGENTSVAQDSRFRSEGLALAPLVGRPSLPFLCTLGDVGESRGGGSPAADPSGLPCDPESNGLCDGGGGYASCLGEACMPLLRP